MTGRHVGARRALALLAVAAIVGLGLAAAGPSGRAGAKKVHDHSAVVRQTTDAGCPPETNSCTPAIPLAACPGCTVTAGPVTGLGQEQAVYVELTGIPSGDEVVLALCTLAQGTQIVAHPNCASSIPPPPGCLTVQRLPCANTPSPVEWQYGTSTGNSLVVSIGTELDPAGSGNSPIPSENADQYSSQTYGSFFCDDGPTNPCGLEVMDIPAAETGTTVIGNGVPPRATYDSTAQNTVIVPLDWATTGNGCGSSPVMEVDSAYSASQFLYAAGASTCTDPGTGVAILPTSIPSIDDAGCLAGSGTHCPIANVLDGDVPVTFTDDPEDPATLAEEKQAGGKVAYIPIAVSATEMAFSGEASAGSSTYPLDAYDLTPAQTAGLMTQLWNDPDAVLFNPNDDLCSQLAGKAQCSEAVENYNFSELVETIGGKYANIVVDNSSNGKSVPKIETIPGYGYPSSDNYYAQATPGTERNYQADTGYSLLNPGPEVDGYPVPETLIGAAFPSTASGASFETTNWICQAPYLAYNVHLPWDPASAVAVKDLMTAPQILSNAERGPIALTKNASGQEVAETFVSQYVVANPAHCQGMSALPTDFADSTGSITYLPSSSPVTAAHAIQGAMSNNYVGKGGFAFSAMDSSQADLYGLLPASLQNAAGQFVQPDETSIDAALADATTNADGTLSPNFKNTTDAAAYPLPMVTYALVSTAPQSTEAEAQQLQDALTNLVTYSHAGGAGYVDPLPAGYEPLPDNLYQAALTDIAKDIQGPSTTPTTTPTTSPTGIPPSTTTGGASQPAGGSSGSLAVVSRNGGLSYEGYHGPVGATGSTVAGGGSTTAGHPISVTLTSERFALPGLVTLAVLCLIVGPLLYLVPLLRRRMAGEPATADGPPEPDDDG
jgi:hypothetical protein